MKTQPLLASENEQKLVESVQVRPIRAEERIRCMRLLKQHHYLGALQPVGEQLSYVAVGLNGGWRAILVFGAAAKHLRDREQWMGWTNEQRRRRLALVGNNARCLILPGSAVPKMATRVLKLALDRVSDDWRERYRHPLAVVETLVDPERFQGTADKAGGWIELGMTSGCGRVGRDSYVRPNKPNRLLVRELGRRASRSLQAEHLKPEWATVEQKVSPRCTHKAREMRSLVEPLKSVPDFRSRLQSDPVWSLLAIVALAYLWGAPRGQKDLAKVARQLNRGQRRALGIRRNRRRECPAPTQPTFSRLLQAVNAREIEAAILAFQQQVRGPAPPGERVALDGKAAKRRGGERLLNAVTVPSLYDWGSEPVPVDKTNEIPVARALFERLDLQGRLVGLDALHTQAETARALVQEAGADYLLTVKGHQKGVRRTVRTLFAATQAAFSPSTDPLHDGMDRREELQPSRTPPDSHSVGYP